MIENMGRLLLIVVILAIIFYAPVAKAQFTFFPPTSVASDGYIVSDSVQVFWKGSFVGIIKRNDAPISPRHYLAGSDDHLFAFYFGGIPKTFRKEEFIVNVEVFILNDNALTLDMVQKYSFGMYPKNCSLFEMQITGSLLNLWADIGNGESKGIRFDLQGYEKGDFDILFKNFREISQNRPIIQKTRVQINIDEI